MNTNDDCILPSVIPRNMREFRNMNFWYNRMIKTESGQGAKVYGTAELRLLAQRDQPATKAGDLWDIDTGTPKPQSDLSKTQRDKQRYWTQPTLILATANGISPWKLDARNKFPDDLNVKLFFDSSGGAPEEDRAQTLGKTASELEAYVKSLDPDDPNTERVIPPSFEEAAAILGIELPQCPDPTHAPTDPAALAAYIAEYSESYEGENGEKNGDSDDQAVATEAMVIYLDELLQHQNQASIYSHSQFQQDGPIRAARLCVDTVTDIDHRVLVYVSQSHTRELDDFLTTELQFARANFEYFANKHRFERQRWMNQKIERLRILDALMLLVSNSFGIVTTAE
ncbi:hypothetical protein MBLNU459_g5099t2 [Dothideomycetes sp. NU459]